jgi:hypothetical protein
MEVGASRCLPHRTANATLHLCLCIVWSSLAFPFSRSRFKSFLAVTVTPSVSCMQSKLRKRGLATCRLSISAKQNRQLKGGNTCWKWHRTRLGQRNDGRIGKMEFSCRSEFSCHPHHGVRKYLQDTIFKLSTRRYFLISSAHYNPKNSFSVLQEFMV